ncbi:MAG: BREX-1 system phosphatase PglZ type A [Selenomonadaceae bacterium]|nr:BREX-1 system phosphatase PglZ type A [Selenomonadaceae bacterium]
MDYEKLVQELNRKFAEPLPDFYKRWIIFWVDEEQDFAEAIDEIKLDGAKVVKLTGKNNFVVKKLLTVDEPASNFLVYQPFAYKTEEDNWLLDMTFYAREFRADLISLWQEELGISGTVALRAGLKAYRKFFKAQARRNKILAQKTKPETLAQLQLAIMAALAGLKSAKPNAIIKAVLCAEKNSVYQEFANYGVDGAFRQMVAQGTGYSDADLNLEDLAAHILLTAATRTLNPNFFGGLDNYISDAHRAYCYDFISDWLHDKADDLRTIAGHVEEKLNLAQRFMTLQTADLVETEIFPCTDEVILVKLMTEISAHIIDAAEIIKTVEKRRTCIWYDAFKNYYEGILQVARMQTFYKKHSGGFHTVEPSKVWEEYTTEYFLMDSYYREFHKNYADNLTNYHARLSDLFNHVAEKVEGLYKNWYLRQLGENWTTASADDLRERGRISGVHHQLNFYRRNVANPANKIYVIISDALRYEVAFSLKAQLERETQAEVKLEAVQGIFPTITKFGMAALLPHDKLCVELQGGELVILADGQSTKAPNRDKVLKSKNPASVALKYEEIIGMKRAERQAKVKGMEIVYIYHDTIDKAGHVESSVFGACYTAIDELKNMVRIITKEWGGTNILITADHGFLYTHSPLTEDDKVDKTKASAQDVEIGRRYAILQKGARPQFLLPVKFFDDKTPYAAFTPRENLRIKMQGGGSKFVHGGISLQELVVPIIDYHFLRNQVKDTKPVEICLYSSGRKISNMMFALNFYQADAISVNRRATTYLLYFVNSNGIHVSDTQKIIADKTEADIRERTFRRTFNLRAQRYNSTESYYLVIANAGGQEVQREEFQIDIAFSMDELDFFS